MSECVNLTGHGDDDPAEEMDTKFCDVINQWLIPFTCAFGVIGNLLNLAILRRRQLQKSFRTLEQGANFCLVYLALSDLMFCLLALLTMLLPADNLYDTNGISLTYGIYNVAIINVFIMESTLLTVAMSLERYLAICFPLRLDIYLTTSRIKYVVLFTFIFSVCFNIPVFWRFEVGVVCSGHLEGHILNSSNAAGVSNNTITHLNSEVTNNDIAIVNATQNHIVSIIETFTTPNSTILLENNSKIHLSPSLSSTSSVIMSHQASTVSSTLISTYASTSQSSSVKTNFVRTRGKTKYTTSMVMLGNNYIYDITYRILWAFFGNVVPLVLLFYFNVCLCRQIYCSYQLRRHLGRQSRTRNTSNSLTLTLVAIVVLFFILVAPSEITLLTLHMTSRGMTPTRRNIEAVLNLMQSINFSVNFILYCIINPYFRKTLKHMVLCGCCWLARSKREWKLKSQTSFM
ncbi:hypothetical protein BsWGS_22266 [Bradybaena similaris]